MILYKYYGAKAGLKAIESRQLGFRTPSKFNDPFELTALSNGAGPLVKQETLRHQIETLKNQVVVLSLTRSPENPLMWAHYGEEHKGFVIAYDVSGDFLCSTNYNLIPADFGDVIYTHTKSPFMVTPENMETLLQVYQQGFGADGESTFQQQALARRLFLTKHASWVYEEEVRIVKYSCSLFEESLAQHADPLRNYHVKPDLPEGLHLFTKKVPITSVFLGARNEALQNQDTRELLKKLSCSVYQLEVDDCSWQLTKKPVIFPDQTTQLSTDAVLSVCRL
jgi:hypothetical protein